MVRNKIQFFVIWRIVKIYGKHGEWNQKEKYIFIVT